VQQVSLVLAYATGDLKVVLRNPQASSSHLTPTLALTPSLTPTLSLTPALSLSLSLSSSLNSKPYP